MSCHWQLGVRDRVAMSPPGRNKDGLLARVNFPLYCVNVLTNQHILVAGGGGSAKTGVANGFEIYELSHDGERYVAEEVLRHETGPSVVMNSSCFSDGKRTFLVAGQESHCQLYNVRMKARNSDGEEKEDKRGKPNIPRKRTVSSNERIEELKLAKDKVDGNSNSCPQLTFDITPNDSIQTDFSKDEPLQRVVRISRLGNLMATGGTDGHVRLWTFPSLVKKVDIDAHRKEVDDVDFSPDESTVVSISKDGSAVIWNTETGAKEKELKWAIPENSKYLYKRCRFGTVEGGKDDTRLFVLTNPVGNATKLPSYLQMWDPASTSLKKFAPVWETLSALSVSSDGRFVAVGTMSSGSVSLYIAFSLQRVLHIPNAHNMFVTGLEFVPNNFVGPSEAAVVSISVDNRVCVHHLPFRSTMPCWLAVALIVATLFLAFVLCSYLGL